MLYIYKASVYTSQRTEFMSIIKAKLLMLLRLIGIYGKNHTEYINMLYCKVQFVHVYIVTSPLHLRRSLLCLLVLWRRCLGLLFSAEQNDHMPVMILQVHRKRLWPLGLRKRSALFWDITRRWVVPSSRVKTLVLRTLEDGTDRLSRNVGTELPLNAA
jgi:hypothetical protein